jgi:hypothetical protein
MADPPHESRHAGVTWDRRGRRWIGKVYNPLTKKYECTKPSTFASDEYDAACASVAALRARVDAQCAAEGVARRAATHGPDATVKAAKQSGVTGVAFHKQRKKWEAKASDPYGVTKYVGLFDDVAAAKAAVDAKRAELVAAYDADMAKLAAADPLTKGLPRAPAHVADAAKRTLYWHVTGRLSNGRAAHTPYRVVRSGDITYEPACQSDGCATFAIASGKGGVSKFCVPCGGGCPHHRNWDVCRECNPNVTHVMNCCSKCGNQLDNKRVESKGGNGLCAACEDHLKAEAAEAGSAPPEKGKTWEDFVLDQLVTMIVDPEGNVVSCEMRDNHSTMLGSLRKKAGVRESKRKRECDTTTKRRADILYIVRDANARLVAAVNVEVDEHSHSHPNYTPECEAGKVDDTFTALWQLAQTEGKARLAYHRTDNVQQPYFLYLKFNPNACDVSPPIPLKTRIAVLARHVNDFLRTPLAEFARRAAAGEANVPHVQCLYYHSVQGGRHLAHFDEHAKGAWDWRGNACPRA